jgi:hypothetical protein
MEWGTPPDPQADGWQLRRRRRRHRNSPQTIAKPIRPLFRSCRAWRAYSGRCGQSGSPEVEVVRPPADAYEELARGKRALVAARV